MLVQLARTDGIVVQKEIDFIKKIGSANGMSVEEISECFKNPLPVLGLKNLSDDERYESLYNVVQLMQIDGRIYKEEIAYCTKIASNLGYDENALGDMMIKIYSDPNLTADKERLKTKIQTYLKK